MYIRSLLLSLLPFAVHAANIVLSNDDGWAEINIRQFYSSLTAAGDSVIISAPAENQSGKGSLDAPPKSLTQPCEFNSCPSGSPAVGNNASMPRFNYVNSFPVTAMKFGLQNLSTTIFGDRPDIALAGPNVGANLGIVVDFSGTVGAATEAAKQGIPGIAFSGATGTQTAWNAAPEAYELIYADLSTNITQKLIASGKPYLPANTWLNVNYPAVQSGCDRTSDFKLVLSRIFPAFPFIGRKDVVTCGNNGRWVEDCLSSRGSNFDTNSGTDCRLKTRLWIQKAATLASVLEKLILRAMRMRLRRRSFWLSCRVSCRVSHHRFSGHFLDN